MKTTAWLLVTMITLPTLAKTPVKNQFIDIRYQTGLLEKISCIYSGYGRTATGPSLGTVDFNVDTDNTVCDPLTNSATDKPENGLLAKLIVPSAAMAPKVSSVMDFYKNGTRLEKNIYFADVNVPTRAFTQGFTTQSGETLIDANGNKLIENFALEYDSILKLSDADKEGDYEIASLADDGARLFVKENDTWSELINNDGIHSTRFGCPYRTIHLTKDSRIPVKLLYFQGPRYYIANVLLWKRHKKAETWSEPSRHSLCGIQGNHLFYKNDTQKPTAILNGLLHSGWSVLVPGNFKMPEQKKNPCVQETLKISDIQIKNVNAPTATITWTTNLPSSSQLTISNFFTGEQITTDLDSVLVTNHEVKLTGLVRGIYYMIQVISVDAKGNKVISEKISLTP
ncbi:MAG: hypothetical protein ACM3MG_12950 [Bacillota bacterium]